MPEKDEIDPGRGFSVAAAFDIPHAGINVNIRIRNAIVEPATASLPRLESIRIRKIHEVMPMSICPMPPSEVRIIPIRIFASNQI
jgi:hypothetical protein